MTWTEETLRAQGFENPKRAAQELSGLSAALGAPAAERIHEAARRTPEPDELIAAFDRSREGLQGLPEPTLSRLLDWLPAVFLASTFAPRLLATRPGLPRWLAGSRTLTREKSREHYRREALAATRHLAPTDTEGLQRRLRRYKYREFLRLMVRDATLRAPMAELGREQTALAEALIGAALAWAERSLQTKYGTPETPGFCILGMGKLGGEDLNFSSDVDLIYLYRADGHTTGGTAGSLPTVQYYTRLGEAVTQALTKVTAEGFCYRVDLNLRPQGRSGAMVLSLPASLAYYESFGRMWERAALIKARAVAGDATLADELLSELGPFIWRRSLDLSAVDGLRDLKAQIDMRGKASTDDVKLGPGGIREVEFFVNALQLLQGGKDPTLREPRTMRALRKLERAGFVSGPDADALEEAYVFLRRVENRLQMLEERQTQALPTGERERRRLASSLGYPGWDTFRAELERHRRFVLEAFSTLLGQTARGEIPDEPLLALALDPDLPLEARREALGQRGFEDSERALAELERLARVPHSPFMDGGSGVKAVRLLSELAQTPDPTQALLHFSDFLARLHQPEGYLGLLTSMPRASRRLFNLFGQSDYLSRIFLRHPELLDALVQAQLDEAMKSPERIRQELGARLGRHADAEDKHSAMPRFKNEEVLRIGLNDIGGDLSVQEVARQLTAVADAVLDECLFLSLEEQRERYGLPLGSSGQREGLVVIAMGKLGGYELGYHSDLDLIFVYSGNGQAETSGGSRGVITHHEYFAKTVQRLMTLLQVQLREGHLYKIDARLRPSGNQGALVVSQDAFREHHQKRAQLWERQALIKARPAAGDASRFRALRDEVLTPLVYERPLPLDAAAEIDRLRTRMERELAQENAQQLNPKLGQGGLVDVEFTVQYLQLLHGRDAPRVRSTNTLMALEGLQTEGRLSPEDAEVLREGYLFLRRVENRLRLIHASSLAHMPTSGRPLAQLARRLGVLGQDPGETFLARYRACAAGVRDVYARILRAPRSA
ncbi:bifunctional [glutamate--ammonia ligase]-adenylyl-L-tyrosine phosphorylase/[glutamate--ammonia-ligase] adenylyltransferase [Vitiosangium sp. GDMCC 1.1324]|uniref:bifunctional [glutamate--ammonia ligase]-adenylyl-L-tyrosine phosphorylase/[glutamate--ammonia-ligase] adenylyltransferase n=1 Tax=Vitiosangium sp. (strain GDMCC 1.1324) TaxID=2138576 RepID=UPI000D33E919|nr:bifunctional [glutamate--ammonia ligase]-adenylyl-L-tyrosine phosphorylase/[glutamate--ammonia-ligase] adenylyltransferase [Vitiosangium sp. GDMCC 1.1324]PTL78271.1 bifunctional [glutamate--ammonia ligase]-adenylyl-L-tyrosine phosphorylase/[glutamate--ammonia-ligase] adenylyltransferase [Vitiosangium sp. GDMCC 1.1324]